MMASLAFTGRDVQAAPTKVTFTGIITNATTSVFRSSYGLPVGSTFSVSFTINPSYNSTSSDCAVYLPPDSQFPDASPPSTLTYKNTSNCNTPLIQDVKFTRSVDSFVSAPNSSIIAYNAADPSYTGAQNLGYSRPQTESSTGVRICRTADGLGCNNLTGWTIPSTYIFTNFGQAYMSAPPLNTGISPTDLIQYYYSSSYYRDYAILTGTTETTTQAVLNFSTGNQIAFNLTGMDIVNDVPGPIPLLGGASAFAWSRRIRRRLHRH